jgi:DNA mismatch endonuclease (patch repair protein)
MPERVSQEVRSSIMRAVRSAGTGSELRLRAILESFGHPFRQQASDLPGRPDFSFDELRLVVFLDGDFWHGRQWFEEGQAPERNRDYWIAKFERNRARDLSATYRLRRRGWSVVRVWESDLHGPAPVTAAIERKLRQLERRRARDQ